MINENLVEILLAAILVSNTYDKDQPVIKWGGIVIAVAGVASALFGWESKSNDLISFKVIFQNQNDF